MPMDDKKILDFFLALVVGGVFFALLGVFLFQFFHDLNEISGGKTAGIEENTQEAFGILDFWGGVQDNLGFILLVLGLVAGYFVADDQGWIGGRYHGNA